LIRRHSSSVNRLVPSDFYRNCREIPFSPVTAGRPAACRSASRLLKNKFRERRAYNIEYASLLGHTFRSASLDASARFSAAR
jgi:hypothetical protein